MWSGLSLVDVFFALTFSFAAPIPVSHFTHVLHPFNKITVDEASFSSFFPSMVSFHVVQFFLDG
jgi:hypothetical protein